MSTTEDEGRTYDSEQVAAILRAAAELDHSTTASRTGSRGGLTLSQIQQIAAEVGISPAAVQAASLATTAPAESLLANRLQLTKTLSGEVPEHARDLLSERVRTVIGPQGAARRTPGGLEIDLKGSGLGTVVINIRSAEGTTTVSLWSERNRASEAAVTGSALGLLGSMGLAANAPGAAVLAMAGVTGMGALLLGGAGVGLGVGIGIWRLNTLRWRRRVADLYAGVVAQVSDTTIAPAADRPPAN